MIAEAAGLLVAASPSTGSPRVPAGPRTQLASSSGRWEQHVSERRQPRDGLRLPRVCRRADEPASGGRSVGPPSLRRLLGPARPHARCRRGVRRRQARCTATGDGDNGMALVLDPITTDRWPRLGHRRGPVRAADWWPAVVRPSPAPFSPRRPVATGRFGRRKPAESLPGRRHDSASKLFV